MLDHQLTEQVGIGGIILGPARRKRFAVTRQSHRIDRKNHNEIVSQQAMDETARRLFQANGDLLVWKLSAELRHPGMKRFGPAFNNTALDFSASVSLQANIDFLVRSIQANEGGIGLV